MNIIIFRKSDLVLVGTLSSEMAIEQEIELNVIPNFGGEVADYASIETDQTHFHLENIDGIITIVVNQEDPIIIDEPVDEEKAAMAEAIIDLNARLSELEAKANA